MKPYLILLLMLVTSFAFGANIGDDKLNLGDGNNAATDKEIIFNDGTASKKKISIDGTTKNLKSNSNNLELGDNVATGDKSIIIKRGGTNPVIKWNETLDRLEFSNDGTIYKAVGSGGGGGSGGTNLLTNESFEDGISLGWTSSGGTFSSQNYTNTEPNNLKFARLVASASGQYFESVATVIPDAFGSGCLAYGRYNTTGNNAFKISFFSAGVEINSRTLPTTNGAQLITPVVPVLCPAAGTLVKIRVESLAAGTIDFDAAYLGTENRTVQVSSPRLVARVTYNAAASCLQQRVSTVFGAFPTSATCGAPTVSYFNQGGVVIATTDQDSYTKFTITSMPKGILEVRGKGTGDSGTGNDYYFLRFNDGSGAGEEQAYYSNPNGAWTWPAVSFKKAYPNGASNLTLELEGRASTSSITVVGSVQGAQYDVYLWPLDTDTAVTNEASGWFIDAQIGGANPSLGVGNVASYSEITNAGLDLVLRPGSAPAQIACASGTASTGLTCSSAESIGLAFVPPSTGAIEVCMAFSHAFSATTPAAITTGWQVVETTNTSSAVLTEGGQANNTGSTTGSLSSNATVPHTNCGIFPVSAVNQKTFRLMYEQVVAGTPSNSLIIADRSASIGQPVIHVTARPWTGNIARPVLTGEQVTTPGGTSWKTMSAEINCDAASVVTRQPASNPWITAIGNISAGACAITISKFTQTPYCTSTWASSIGVGSSGLVPQIVHNSATSLTLHIDNTSANATTYDGVIHCEGE